MEECRPVPSASESSRSSVSSCRVKWLTPSSLEPGIYGNHWKPPSEPPSESKLALWSPLARPPTWRGSIPGAGLRQERIGSSPMARGRPAPQSGHRSPVPSALPSGGTYSPRPPPASLLSPLHDSSALPPGPLHLWEGTRVGLGTSCTSGGPGASEEKQAPKAGPPAPDSQLPLQQSQD